MRAANNQRVKSVDIVVFTELGAEKTMRLPNRPPTPRLQIRAADKHASDFRNRAPASGRNGRDGREDIA